ncbi:myeloid differentiation primary response protein MyD88 [Elysia marginata]|uniref:Myeloid differentiation primary response protein MyD88 n=1 Tax=Elysia marginata TaxID=1093978 RepID=A0AAV4F164_9GAST|nr:myeloid differentiation primary response protein MyD88 [Elysia marginata]
METDIDWRCYLGENHEGVPLHALRRSATHRIGMFLSQVQVMHNDIVPDFGGLAELIGFDGVEIKKIHYEITQNDITFNLSLSEQNFERASNPGKAVLDEWMNRSEFDPTIGHLVKLLARLGREDILTDCRNMIASEAKFFLDKPKQFLDNQLPIQENTVSQGPGSDEVPDFITRDEVILRRKVNYDAFVCFNAFGESGKDFEFVKELIRRFENPPYNYKLFVPHRDDLAGLAEHNINATIISQRCRHMIVVLSNNFMESPACTFQSAFAHSLSPGAQNKRLIPVVIEEMIEMPNIMRIISQCDFTKKVLHEWSWERLANSISVPLNPEDYKVQNSVEMDGFLSHSSTDLRSHFLPSEPMYSPSSSADSGCWSPNLASSGVSENFTSNQQSTGTTYSHSSTNHVSAPGPSKHTSSGSVANNSLERKISATTRPGIGRPSSPSLGSRALKKIKQTFSSDKRKSGPQTGL